MFRRDQKNEDNFQKQISALRQQLGASADELDEDEITIDSDPTPIWSAPTAEQPQQRSYAYDATSYVYPEVDQRTSFDLAVPEQYLPALPQIDANATVIAHQAKWVGELSTADPIHVHGKFEGVIHSESEVFIGEGADVQATVTAGSVVVAGLIRGELHCSGRLEVLPTGRVMADVQSPALVVHQGAILTGSVKMNPPESTKPTAATNIRKPARIG